MRAAIVTPGEISQVAAAHDHTDALSTLNESSHKALGNHLNHSALTFN